MAIVKHVFENVHCVAKIIYFYFLEGSVCAFVEFV